MPSASSTSAEPDLRRHRPVAVLGDRDAGGRRDEGGGRRDVERAAAVAARPDDVDRAVRRLDVDRALAHRRGEPGQLVDGLAAHAETHQQGGQLGRRRLAVHHRAHRPVRLVHRQRAAVDDRVERGADQVAHRTPSPTASASPAVANEPDRVVQPRGLAFPGLAQEVREQVRALRGQDGFGVELDALERQRDVADAHDDPVDLAHRGHAQLRRERREVDREGVVARGHERRRHALEQAWPSWVTSDASPWTSVGARTIDAPKAAAIDCIPRQTPRSGRPRSAATRTCSDRDPGIVRVARTGRDDDPAQVGRRVVGHRRDASTGRSRRCARRAPRRRRPGAPGPG